MLYPVVENSVFYNPVQVQNRDLSILMIGMYTERRIERLWRVNKKKEIRKVMLARQSQGQVQQRKRAASSIHGTPGGEGSSSSPADLRSTLEQAFQNANRM